MKIVIFFALLLFVSSAYGQPSMFAGYDEFCGLPVFVESTPQDAVATIRNGKRVILVDPNVITNWKLSRIFALAHECGHHKLGHLSRSEQFSRQHMNATRRQELKADCWAARALASNGYFNDIKRTIMQNVSQGPIMQGPYPSGMERATYIAKCARIKIKPPGFPSGHGMQRCGCWGPNPPSLAYEAKCASKKVRINICQGMCAPGHPRYAYVCK